MYNIFCLQQIPDYYFQVSGYYFLNYSIYYVLPGLSIV